MKAVVNLTNNVQNLYPERERKKKKGFSERNLRIPKQNDGLEDSILKKMSILSKCIYRFNKSPIKITAGFLIETDNADSIIHMEMQRMHNISQDNFENKQRQRSNNIGC